MPPTRLDVLRKTLETQGEIARAFESLVTLSPDTAKVLVAQMADAVGLRCGDAAAADRQSRRGDGPLGEVERYFVRIGNTAKTKAEIVEETGINPNSLHTLLYGANKDMFDRLDNPAGGKGKIFRLTEEALRDARASHGMEPVQAQTDRRNE